MAESAAPVAFRDQYDAHDWFKSGVSQAEKYRLTEVDRVSA